MPSINSKHAFCLLQPYCINVAKKADTETIKSLKKELEKVIIENSDCIDDLKEYIMFPLLFILKTDKESRSDVKYEELLKTMKLVISFSTEINWPFFKDVFLNLVISISCEDNPTKACDRNEEFKMLVLQNVECLMKNFSKAGFNNFISCEFRPSLGHSIYKYLQFAQTEKNNSVRIQSLLTTKALGFFYSIKDLAQKERFMISNAFANFLPGIALTTSKMLTLNEITNHKVLVSALSCWSYFVYLVMNDEFILYKVPNVEKSETLQGLEEKLYGKLDKQNSEEIEKSETSDKIPSVEITKQWILSTSEKLHILILEISKLVSHSHWAVRTNLVEWCWSIVGCRRSLSKSFMIALKTLLILKNDDDSDVQAAANNTYNRVKQILEDEKVKSNFSQVLVESVYSLIVRIPTIVLKADDRTTLSSFRQLNGLLELMKHRQINVLMHSGESLRLMKALVFTLTLDTTDMDILLEKPFYEDTLEANEVKPQLGKMFQYFRDGRIFDEICTLCSCLIHNGCLNVYVDLLLDLMQESLLNGKEILFLLCIFLNNVNNLSLDDEAIKCIDAVIDVLITSSIFDLPIYANTCQKEAGLDNSGLQLVHVSHMHSVSLEQIKDNVLIVSNALNLIGSCGRYLGKDLELLLSKVLCLVMEKAGESNALISQSACSALSKMAEALSCSSVPEFIEKSVPHFWYMLSLRLRKLNEYPTAPLMLQFALQCGHTEVQNYVEELIEELLDALDSYHFESSVPLLRVLRIYVFSLVNAKGENVTDTTEKDTLCDEKIISRGSVSEFLKFHHENTLKINTDIEGTGEQNDCNAEKEIGCSYMKEENENKPVPRNIKLVVSILERCSHLLLDKDRNKQLLILDIITYGCSALEIWEDERLPVFHKLWRPLVLRLRDRDYVVMLRTLDVCILMIQTSGDFLRIRTIKEVLPPIINFLKEQHSTSLRKGKSPAYQVSIAYKTQKKVLGSLHYFVESLDLGVIDVSHLTEVVSFYLLPDQPHELYKLALLCLVKIATIRPHHVWLMLAHMKGPLKYESESSLFPCVKVPGCGRKVLSPDLEDLFSRLS